VVQIDIESDSSIAAAVEHITTTYGLLDVLINNAGAAFDYMAKSQGLSSREMWNKSWDVNVSGTQVLTEESVPLLLKSTDPRLLFLRSVLTSNHPQ
jgi:NAD(P)-dependent dehydrogenase (short-subunit alcohol dehydrogenase family)